MLNLDHAFTGCVQWIKYWSKLGLTGVIHYIHNHRRPGQAYACAQSRPCQYWLCTKDIVVMLGNTCAIFSHIQSLGFRSGLHMCSIPTITGCVQRISYRSRWASRVLFITYTIIEGLVGPVLCTISIMLSLVVYKRILYWSGLASQVLFITYTIIEGQVGLGLCSILTMPSLVVYKGYRSSRVLFFTYAIIEGFIEPEHMRNRISLVGHH